MNIEIEEVAINMINKFIEENKINAEISEIDLDNEGYGTIEVLVDRKDYSKIQSMDGNLNNYLITWKPKTPPLIHAEVGDLVLVFNEYSYNEEQDDVAFVSSKFVKNKGDICYGCRYIKIGLDNNFLDQMYDFEVTDENYGGLPTGFLKVLTPDEAMKHLNKQLEVALIKEFEALQVKFDRSIKQIGPLFDTFAKIKSKKITCQKIDVEDLQYLLNVKINSDFI